MLKEPLSFGKSWMKQKQRCRCFSEMPAFRTEELWSGQGGEELAPIPGRNERRRDTDEPP